MPHLQTTDYHLQTRLPANTLIITILLTTVMIFIAVGVLTLIIQGSLTIGALESSTRAIFASDSGVELGLLHVKNHQPGYEQKFKDINLAGTMIDTSVISRVECLPKSDSCPPTAKNIIGANQSASIPLFRDTAQGLNAPIIDDGTNFTLNFRGEKNTIGTPQTAQFQWKILGTKDGETESITDYINAESGTLTETNTGQTQDELTGEVNPGASIFDFLQSHKQNYLVITNVSPQGIPIEWDITYRGNNLADDKFTILSTGTHQGYSQTQQVEVPLGEFLPFFHYAIFSPN